MQCHGPPCRHSLAWTTAVGGVTVAGAGAAETAAGAGTWGATDTAVGGRRAPPFWSESVMPWPPPGPAAVHVCCIACLPPRSPFLRPSVPLPPSLSLFPSFSLPPRCPRRRRTGRLQSADRGHADGRLRELSLDTRRIAAEHSAQTQCTLAQCTDTD